MSDHLQHPPPPPLPHRRHHHHLPPHGEPGSDMPHHGVRDNGEPVGPSQHHHPQHTPLDDAGVHHPHQHGQHPQDDSQHEAPPPPEEEEDHDPKHANQERSTRSRESSKSPDRYVEGDIAEYKDAEALAQEELVMRSTPSTELEIALYKILDRKQGLIDKITGEITKLKSFVQKRKQTYKRKRKEDGAPTRALSAYNMFIKERFAQLAKENEEALKSDDANAKLKRVPPANLVAKTGNEWKELPEEVKAKYEERAKEDRKRYEEQMAQYQPPDKQANRKRNKTGYNMFFSSHVLRLKQTESGVPSERGSVARLVGTAWKQLSNDEKMYYEREADKHNGMNPVKDADEEEDEEEMKAQQHMDHHYAYPPVHAEMHMQHVPPPPPPMHGMPQHPGAHDPRAHHYYPPPPPHHMYGPNAYGHYDYSQHHQRHPPQGRQSAYQYHY